MKATVTQCDRCGEIAHKFHEITVEDKKMDLCHSCFGPLDHWLSRDNTTRPGDHGRPLRFRGPRYIEVCSHHIPCAGPCPQPMWKEVRR